MPHSEQSSSALIVHPLYPLAPPPFCAQGLDDVPQDLLCLIAEFVDDADTLHTYGCISKRCRQAAADDALWRRLHFTDHPFMPSKEPKRGEWKHLYWYNKKMHMHMLRSIQDEMNRVLHPHMFGRQQTMQIPATVTA